MRTKCKRTPAGTQFIAPQIVAPLSEMMTPTKEWGFPGGSVVKKKKICLQCSRPGFSPWVRKIPWRKKWQSTPLFLPGKSHEERRLVDYSPWGRRVRHNLECLLRRYGSPVDCCRARGSGCSRPGYGISPLGGGHH